MPAAVRIFRYTALLLLLLLGVQGILSSWSHWAHADSLGRVIQTTAQLLYGMLGLVASWYVARKRALPPVLEWAWTAVIIVAAGFAPVVWGSSSIVPGLVSAVAGLILAVGILWLARRGSRSPTGPQT